MTGPLLSSPPKPAARLLQLCLAIGALGCASTPVPAESASAAPSGDPSTASVAASSPAAEPSTPALAEPAPTPSAEPADVRGKEQIQAVIAANRERVRACYDAAQKKDPGLQGDLVVAFVINPDGSVKTAEVNSQESEIHSPELDTCAIAVLKTLKFPASSRGLESKVAYPFNFKPAAR